VTVDHCRWGWLISSVQWMSDYDERGQLLIYNWIDPVKHTYGVSHSSLQYHISRKSAVKFYQHFMSSFFVRKCFAQLSLVTFQLCNFWQQNIGAKCVRKMLMKLITGVNFFIFLCATFMHVHVGPTSVKPRLRKTILLTRPFLHFWDLRA